MNGYLKNGYNGLEVNIGRWSIIEIEPEDMPELKQNIINVLLFYVVIRV